MSTVTEASGGETAIVTLIRGKKYSFNHKGLYYDFERAVAKQVPIDVAEALSELSEDIPDGDGDMITKDVFRIDRDASSLPAHITTPTKQVRFRLVKEEVVVKPKIAIAKPAPARKPPVGFAPRKAG